MSAHHTRNRDTMRYTLEITGEREEYGLTDNVFRFRASISAPKEQLEVSMIQGLLIDHECEGDLCIRVLHSREPSVLNNPVDVLQGTMASEALLGGVDVKVRIQRRGVLFLHHPIITEIDSNRQPGTRLLSSLRKHFAGRSLDIVVDLGTAEADIDFNHYFFPDLNLIDLNYQSTRLLYGQWPIASEHCITPFEFGVEYG